MHVRVIGDFALARHRSLRAALASTPAQTGPSAHSPPRTNTAIAARSACSDPGLLQHPMRRSRERAGFHAITFPDCRNRDVCGRLIRETIELPVPARAGREPTAPLSSPPEIMVVRTGPLVRPVDSAGGSARPHDRTVFCGRRAGGRVCLAVPSHQQQPLPFHREGEFATWVCCT